MSKLQLLYEKLMRISYIFGGVFFLLSLIDFVIAMMTGAFSCSSGTCGIKEEYPFYSFTLLPLIILTIIFFITGYILFKLANKESDLLSVSEYKKSLEETDITDEVVSREELYEKLRRGNRKPTVKKEPFFKKLTNSISAFFADIRKNREESRARKAELTAEQKTIQLQAQKQEEERIEKEKLSRARTKLNKTGLILLLSQNTDLSQNNARLFVNALLDTIKSTVIAEDEVKIANFGRFEKVFVEQHTEKNEETGVETSIPAHNTVDFFAYKPFLELLNVGMEIEETLDVDEKIVQEVEEIKDTSQDNNAEQQKDIVLPPTDQLDQKEEKSEVVIEDSVIKEVIIEEDKEEIEEQKEEIINKDKEVKQESKDIKQEQKEKDVSVQKTETALPPKPVKKEKVKPIVKTKKQIIEMMDETTDLSKNKANKFLKFFAEVVKEQLIKRDDIELEGIGYFTTIEMPAKEAVNPQTNEKIVVPAHHQVRLRFDDELKDKMNE